MVLRIVRIKHFSVSISLSYYENLNLKMQVRKPLNLVDFQDYEIFCESLHFSRCLLTLYHIRKISIFLVALENTVFTRGSER